MGKDIHGLIVGIDEAGRGPIIGDMILVAAVFESQALEKLKELRVKDSKELNPHIRAQLFLPIIENSVIIVSSHITPEEIDSFNLNKLLLERIIYLLKIISLITGGKKITSIIIDEIKGWQKILPGKIKEIAPNAKLIVEPKADSKYIVVSAASIVAKYIRDLNLKPTRRLLGDFGSGYPSDPRTREWIVSEYETEESPPPRMVRRTWSTLSSLAPSWFIKKQAKPLREKTAQKSILDYIISKQ